LIKPLITIVRIEDNFEHGTFGILLVQTEIFGLTLEPHVFGNKPNISCIPAGCYEMQRKVSFTFGTTYEVQNVPDRSDILFHKGNEAEDTRGCIILGGKFGKLGKHRAVLNSGSTFVRFMNAMHPYPNLSLIIKEAWV